MTWEPELEELRRREQLARRMGGEERVARQHASGRLTVRERIERLLYDSSFHETGALAGRATYGGGGELEDFLPANTVIGKGRVDGRRVWAAIRRGARGLFSIAQANVPWVSGLVRKVYGVAGAGHGDGSRLNLRYARPSENWDSLPLAGGLEAASRRELEAAGDPAALRAEIAQRLEAVTSLFRTAERSQSRRSSTRATRGRSSVTGPSARTSWCGTSSRPAPRRAGRGPSCSS